MTGSVRLALALVPLATYFFVLGSWQSGRKPKMVAGPIDFGLLSFGLGNLLAFGPVGQFVVYRVFPAPSLFAWLTVAAFVALVSLFLAPRTAHRLVIYHVSDDDLRRAVWDALEKIEGDFDPTVTGFEDRRAGRGVRIEVGKRLNFGVVEGYGDRGERLIALLAPRLNLRLRDADSRPSLLATFWVVLGSLTMIVPLSSLLLGRTAMSAAIRAVFDRLRGG